MSRTLTDQASSKPSREGIALFEGDVRELDGKAESPGSLLIAQWEGLKLFWDYEPSGVVLLRLSYGSQISDPILCIPLSESELQIVRDHIEKGGWGYYDLKVEENDARAAVNVSLVTAENKPVSLLWIIDSERRAAVRRAINQFLGEDDPVFDEPLLEDVAVGEAVQTFVSQMHCVVAGRNAATPRRLATHPCRRESARRPLYSMMTSSCVSPAA